MDCLLRIEHSNEGSSVFLENGRNLLSEFIAQWKGRCKIPIQNFSAKELAKATNNFDSNSLIYEENLYKIYRGLFRKRPILVKKYDTGPWAGDSSQYVKQVVVRDTVVSSLMSVHKNVLKVIGCCLDLEYQALVFQIPELSDPLSHHMFYTEESKLSWQNRLCIASDITNVLAFLHTGFETPIIHRNLELARVVIDRYGVAKFSDFSCCISIPLGESEVEVRVDGIANGYMAPEYCIFKGVISEKTDVYNIGLILAELLIGRKLPCSGFGVNFNHVIDMLKSHMERDALKSKLNGDTEMEGKRLENEQEVQFRDFAALALKCLEVERDNRPEMVDVAKDLRRIRLSACSTSSS